MAVALPAAAVSAVAFVCVAGYLGLLRYPQPKLNAKILLLRLMAEDEWTSEGARVPLVTPYA